MEGASSVKLSRSIDLKERVVAFSRSIAMHGIEEITVEEAVNMVESGDAILLDVRTPQEYYAEHVEGVKWIPLDQLSQRIGELDKEKVILACFCRSGSRSHRACEILRNNGFTRLFNVRGGIIAWKEAGFKTVSS